MAVKKKFKPNIEMTIDARAFDRKLAKLINNADDLSPAFHTIGRMFRQSRKTIFQLRGAGGWARDGRDLAPATKARKIRDPRSRAKPYPILKYTGELEKSLTTVGHKHNVNIVTKKAFAFGTNLPYAKYHNSLKKPRRKMPLRMFVFWGPEAPRTMRNRTDATKKFYVRALRVLENFITRDARYRGR